MTENELQRVENLLVRLLADRLRTMGARLSGSPGVDQVMAETGIAEEHREWLRETLRVLAAGPPPDPDPTAWADWEAGVVRWRSEPGVRAKVALLDRALRGLPAVLTGAQPAVEVLFPDSSMDLVEGVYRDDPAADAGRTALAAQVAAELTARAGREPELRVLEVGAGTGATTDAVLAALAPLRDRVVEYAYTDVSHAFLRHAERRFQPGFPALSRLLFDVERPPAEQGLVEGGYDVVVAANVLHTTRSIREALRNVKALLKPDGVLLANELVGGSLFAHLTFGLLEGWWRAEDVELRLPGGPALAPATWARVLDEEGLRPLALPEVPGAEPGQRLLGGRGDGVVRRAVRPVVRPGPPGAHAVVVPVRAGDLVDGCAAYLTGLVADALKMPADRIRPDEPLHTYGLDSLLVVQLTAELRRGLGKVSGTVFFEHPTIAELAAHLTRTNPAELAALTAVSETAATSTEPGTAASAGVSAHPPVRSAPAEPRTAAHPVTSTAPAPRFPVAVIGLAGRYPGAADVDEFWANLRAGRNCVTEIPSQRWDWRAHHSAGPLEPGAVHTRWGGFLDDVDAFDPLFFRVSPAEAETVDPQERLFLQTAYAAVEDAGHTPRSLSPDRRVGVFVGVMNGNYPTGAHHWSVANRVSYSLDLTGPSMAVDTACSASLTAIHLAIQSLASGECDTAIAGGVNLIVDPVHYQRLSSLAMLAADDRCKAFGEGADGFVDGEGVGAVVLKPLTAALADGDHVHGVITGSRVNSGGRTGGYTVPNPKAQARLVAEVLELAGRDARSVSYVEAHGTGTALGDPIEIAALTSAFRLDTADTGFCAIGSVKTNIGHGESAAGIAGLTKVLLQMRHGELVPSLHAERTNPEIDFPATPFRLQREVAPWERPRTVVNGRTAEAVRVAGVSSFGAGGSNAHLVVEEHRPTPTRLGTGPALVVLSARTVERLRQRAVALRRVVGSAGDLHDIAYTLQVGREPMEARVAFVVRSTADLGRALDCYLSGGVDPGRHEGRADRGGGTGCSISGGTSRAEVEGWLRNGQLAAVADAWVRGEEVDWNSGDVAGRRRVPLPTYPFAKQRFWLTRSEAAALGLAVPAGPADRTTAPAGAPDPAPVPVGDRVARPVGATAQGSASDTEPATPTAHATPPTTAPTQGDALLLVRRWSERPVGPGRRLDGFSRHVVLLCGDWPADTGSLLAERSVPGGPPLEAVVLGSTEPAHDRRFTDHAVQLIAELSELLRGGITGRTLVQLLLPAEGADEELSGALRTATLEHPRLVTQLIVACSEVGRPAELALENGASPDDFHVRYSNGRRLVAEHVPVNEPTAGSTPTARWRDGGVYLVTGGAGGLGALVAVDIARRVRRPTLVLVGRSAPDARTRAAVAAVEVAGATAEYHAVDIVDPAAVGALVADLGSRHGGLTGIVHCAGVLADGFMLRKHAADVRRVLAPKVTGLVNLDLATKDVALDLVVLFSSASAALGNAGQADYAAANGFLGFYAGYRNRLAVSGERHGRAVAIDWPLWRDGGMAVDEVTERGFEATGVVALEAEAGLGTLDRVLATGADRVVVLPGDREKIMARLRPRIGPTGARANTGPDPDVVRDRVVDRLVAQLGAITKLSPEEIDPAEPLELYGINSVMITRWNGVLGEVFTELPKTLFFEQRSIAEAADYLLAEHEGECSTWVGTPTAAPPERPVHQERLVIPDRSAAPGVGTARTARTDREPIAIVGMAGRYPMADDLDAYWENLVNGRDCISEIPRERWPLEDFYHPDANEAVARGASYSKWGGFVDSFAEFDPLFFHMSPREVATMDPQERLFIATCWEAMEDAGYTKDEFARRHRGEVGVFAGVTKTGFNLYGPELRGAGRRGEPHTSFASAANRVSYLLDLRGPSMPVDTMCSSSLVAVHEACEHILSGECSMAFAGGVNLYLHPSNYVGMCAHRMLSVDGRCKSFGSSANGYVPGEGVGVVLLKRLADALADGDHVYAVIKGTSVNHGGHTHGYTVPNPVAQRDLIRRTLDKAGVDARSVTCIEAHGTGTDLGDPIEISGLTQAFRADTADNGFCAIGSVKSNIGHLEAAAGIAGLMKVVLQMRHGVLVPSLHSTTTNPNIRFEQTPFTVQGESAPWVRPTVERDGGPVTAPRVAGVSSFGAGGVNAHVLVEEHVPVHEPVDSDVPALVVLSARTGKQLESVAARLLAAVENGGITDVNLASAAYTLQVGREPMGERLAVAVSDTAELADVLRAVAAGRDAAVHRGAVKSGRSVLALLADGDAGPSIPTLFAEQKYDSVLALWVMGAPVDWHLLHGERPPRRLSLPTYPFARERYWVRDENGALITGAAPAPVPDAQAPAPAAPVTGTSEAARPRSGTPVRDVGVPGRDPVTAVASPRLPTAPIAEPAPPPAARPSTAQLGEELVDSLSDILSIRREEIDRDETFVNLGLDSIIGVEWVQWLNGRYGLDLTASKIYSHPTVREFAIFLGEEVNRTAPAPRVTGEDDALRTLIEQVRRGDVDVDQADSVFRRLGVGGNR
ncbi:SDR family NAD(P)-dependent oxidoreductase [Actinokineospora sp. PR83]|uniref:SDR family NAD(P)-dependent oxidoreductase n=1 Tax=Actinokineospora sp. PR83 TaxID=2884908 RepID=UPI0027DF2151|nr:SDR family NAD(P)-dependent oxidoreductase [Actinokineospora sp. PR83]MCG8915259.1 SDR family NAD(P)-dependent oxidoreductase [Actinokineospora sp. PR83]